MIQLRAATIADLQILEHWDKQQHIIDCDPTDDWNWAYELPRTPEWREQLVAELDGSPIGFIQIIDPHQEETHYWQNVPPNLRAIDIWIGEKTDLNKGYGTAMMRLALERCFADSKVTSVLIDPLEANIKAHRFYERLGFEFVEKRDFYGSDCFVYQFTRVKWEST